MLVTDGTYSMFVSGSHAAPCQSAAPCAAGICNVPRKPPSPATIGGVYSGPICILQHGPRFGVELGREIDQILF